MSEPRGPESRPRVLLITRNLPPLRGGMERLNLYLAIELAKEFDVAVIGPRGCRTALPDSIRVSEVAAAPLWRFFTGALLSGISLANQFHPDVVFAGSGLAAPFAWLAAKSVGARTAIYVHGLDLIANHPVFRWFWRPFIRRADLCIANSANTAALARSIGVDANRIAIVHPGVSMPSAETTPDDFRSRFGLADRPLLLSVGRLIARKGLLQFVENALPRIAAAVPQVCLIVLGDELPDLLHGDSTGLGDRIRQCAARLGVAGNLCFVGPQDDATLAMAYRAAAVHVFPVLEVPGDIEGFGMVAVEAAVHGLPTVAFAVGGVPDAVSDTISGDLLVPGDYEKMAQKIIERLLKRHDDVESRGARDFAGQFTWEKFGTRIRDLVRHHFSAPASPSP